MARTFLLQPYKFIILLIIIYLLYASFKEGFLETTFTKATDRANPLAASQTPFKQIIKTGISEEDGVRARLMNQMALNNFNT
jgi:hypothetical protein